MKTTRSAVIALFVALGVKTADKWPKARLLGRISKLEETVDEASELGESTSLCMKLMAATAAEEDIEIEDDVVEGGEPAKKPTKKAAKKVEEEAKPAKKAAKKAAKKVVDEDDEENEENEENEDDEDDEDDGDEEAPKKPAKKAVKKEAKVAKTEVKKDKFGSKLGTGCAEINAVIGKKGKTAKEIAEESGRDASFVRCHLRVLQGKGYIVRDEEAHTYKTAAKKTADDE